MVSITIKSLLYLFLITVTVNGKVNIVKCLQKESLTCLQTYAYRQIREIVNQPSISFVGGLELVKNVEISNGERSASDVDAEILDSDETGNFEKREILLEQFIADKATQLIRERSLRWNYPVAAVTSAVRSFTEILPFTVGSVMAEGRGKKILKAILPLVLGMKLKVVGFLLLSYLAIALLAKQAMVSAVISLAISVIAVIRGYILHKRHPHYTEHHVGLGAATPILPSFGHLGFDLGESYTGYSAALPAASYSLPYAAYKPLVAARR